ncbi:hypothetical protein C8F01DRAFT_1230238 [Mycena amicta]|nr:hypothetical protein C8F01DRAFT_1230238 [Mycena amicta]
MTRSELSAHSPRVVRKAFRAQARSQGISYPQAVAAAKARATADGAKQEFPESTRRNLGKMDGVKWNGDSFVCPGRVDGGVFRAQEDAARDVQEDGLSSWEENGNGEERRPTTIEVNLLDIARPTKRRGLAKKHASHRTLPMHDDTANEQWEQWEQWTEASFGEESEVWELESVAQSEEWEIPLRDYTAEEWEEFYAERLEQTAPPRSYSQALKATG